MARLSLREYTSIDPLGSIAALNSTFIHCTWNRYPSCTERGHVAKCFFITKARKPVTLFDLVKKEYYVQFPDKELGCGIYCMYLVGWPQNESIAIVVSYIRRNGNLRLIIIIHDIHNKASRRMLS